MCQNSLPSGGGRSVEAKISGGRQSREPAGKPARELDSVMEFGLYWQTAARVHAIYVTKYN